jgi:selenium metabolism protein YedF
METIDARGLSCPQPVILARKAIEKDDLVDVLVDNKEAVENIKRMSAKTGCSFSTEEKEAGIFLVHLKKEGTINQEEGAMKECSPGITQEGPLVIVFSENAMGRGKQELGQVLIKAFIHTLCQRKTMPDSMIFYNTAVLLAVNGSEVMEDLKQMAEAGVEILVCGTCTNYFGVTKDVGVGVISNMYDIADKMCEAGRLVMP